MSKIAVYRVRRPFKYNGVMLKQDQPFEPSGGKFDDQLKRSSLLYMTEVTESEYVQMQAEWSDQHNPPPPKKKVTRRRRAKA